MYRININEHSVAWHFMTSIPQVTRSIGDFDVKAATHGGVTAQPEILETTLQVCLAVPKQ